jgi:rfaE bifunctional protein kinase chain/domain/rfaE bifunctional protein nucleotidyltransferase chain/domain
MKKVFNFDEIDDLRKTIKRGKSVVLCHGVFDLVHIGHLKHFQSAKKLGDILIVSLTKDEFINKGPGRPIFNHKIRAEYILSFKNVDYVIINDFSTAVPLIKKLKPNIYCKGIDYKDARNDLTLQIDNEKKAIESVKGKIRYTDELTSSSSLLINKFSQIFSTEQKKNINFIKKETKKNTISDFNKLSKLKVLVIGESIVDHYHFCEVLGKSGKDPILAVQELYNERYAGGAAAIAGHLSSCCNSVTLLSVLGDKNNNKSFFEKVIPKKIKKIWLVKKKTPTIIKKRYIDTISNNKILSTYNIDDRNLDSFEEKKLEKIIKRNIRNYDLVIVSDYGHGFLSKNITKLICKESKYLALNAQINAANRGYHTMKNYKNCNIVIINETELRHEMRDKNSDLKKLMKLLSFQLNINDLIVTMGRSGSILFNKYSNNFFSCEAFAKNVVDKIGAGDAMLAILSVCLRSGVPKRTSLLIGSLSAAQSVETIGNKKFVDFQKIKKIFYHILK